MYIQKINIKNFKSLKEETIMPFCQGLTVITGANGSGKSNLLDAVKFILCRTDNRVEKFSNFIKSEEKECFVEIIFECDEARLTLGRKLVRNDDNSLTELYYKDRIEVTKAIYENTVQTLSGIVIEEEYDTSFTNNVENSKIYLSDNIYCCLERAKYEETGTFLKEKAKEKQIIVISHNDGIIKKADSILEIPTSSCQYDLWELLKTKTPPLIHQKEGRTYQFNFMFF